MVLALDCELAEHIAEKPERRRKRSPAPPVQYITSGISRLSNVGLLSSDHMVHTNNNKTKFVI